MMLSLGSDEIGVWFLEVTRFSRASRPLGVIPNAEELERAKRFRHAAQSDRFLTVRTALRGLLGRYLGVAAAEVSLAAGLHGKPVLADGAPDRRLAFNISHSGDWALLAFARDRAVGVDVERIRPLLNQNALAERCLAPRELSSWRGLATAERLPRLFGYWVCKEAFGKATGLGIQVGLASVEIAGEPPRLSRIPAVHGAAEDWQLEPVEAAEGYRACVCYSGAKGRLRLSQLTPDRSL